MFFCIFGGGPFFFCFLEPTHSNRNRHLGFIPLESPETSPFGGICFPPEPKWRVPKMKSFDMFQVVKVYRWKLWFQVRQNTGCRLGTWYIDISSIYRMMLGVCQTLQTVGKPSIHWISRWWFQTFFFTPTWGNDPIWLYNIFQMGWNHQPDIMKRKPLFKLHYPRWTHQCFGANGQRPWCFCREVQLFYACGRFGLYKVTVGHIAVWGGGGFWYPIMVGREGVESQQLFVAIQKKISTLW